VVTVVDDGPGIPPEHMGRLTEPYFTTRADIGGLGLRLFVTRGIVDDHHGQLTFDSDPDRSTTVRITLPGVVEAISGPTVPVARRGVVVPFPPDPRKRIETAPPNPAAVPAPVEASAPPETTAASTLAKPTVLNVDDEPLVVRLLATVVQKTWDVTTATNGAEALRSARVTDVR
jgi:CheY-like chemotaxis protein